MRQSSKRFISMVLALGFLVGAFIVLFELIQPTYANLTTLKGQEVSSEQYLTNEQAIVAQVKKQISQSESDQSAATGLTLAMPSGPDISGAVAQIYGIAENSGIAITTMDISPPHAELGGAMASSSILRPMGIVQFQVVGSGSYEALKSFLSGVETNIRIFDVTGLSITPAAAAAVNANGKKAATTDMFTYNMTIVTYYQLP